MSELELQPEASWHEIFMDMAFSLARRSRDPSTKVASILVSPDHRHLVTGFNGFAQGLPNRKDWWETRGLDVLGKDTLVRHAEENCFGNARTDTTGWDMYVTHQPCVRCASLCVHNKLSKVFFRLDVKARYNPELARQILHQGKVQLIKA